MQTNISSTRDGGTFGFGITPGAIIWSLFFVGFAMVCLAGPLAQALVPKAQTGPDSYVWRPEEARDIALNLRIIGSMVFALGLMERLVLEIRSFRDAIQKQ